MTSVGPHSANLTPLEKAGLKSIEEGNLEQGMHGFLTASFGLVLSALEAHFETVDFDAVEALAERVEESELFATLEPLFWYRHSLTPWGKLFLLWVDNCADEPLSLSLEELNDYLLASLRFYDSLDIPVLELESLVPEPPIHRPMSDVVEELTDSGVDDYDELELSDLHLELDLDVDLDSELELELGPNPGMVELEEEEFLETAFVAESADQKPPAVEKPAEQEPQTVDEKPAIAKEEVQPELEPPRTPKPPPARTPDPPSPDDEEGEELTFTQAPTGPIGEKNRLVVRNKYLGYGKNSEGVMGLCGQLKISYFRDTELVGRVESSNPLLFLSPVRLSGTKSTVTYWLPPVAFPHPAGQLTIKLSGENKTLSLNSLFPKSRTEVMTNRQVVLFLLLPALLGFLYFTFVYLVTTGGIDREAYRLFPDLYEAALNGVPGTDFRSGGLGLYRLKVVPAAESLQMIWATVLFVAPFLSSKFFYFLSPTRKTRFAGLLVTAQLLPTLLLMLCWSFQGSYFPLFDHPDFAALDLRSFLFWSVPMNLIIAGYQFLSVLGVLDKKVKPPELRLVLPVALSGLYAFIMFIVIYGRSWIS